MISKELVGRVEDYFWPGGFRRDAWMIVDSARDQRIYGTLLSNFYSEHTCLFHGNLSPQLQLAAPYLVELKEDDQPTRRFLNQALRSGWGILLKCDTRVEPLRQHLRDLLMVRDTSGNHLMFRYYDPRVLRVFLPTCTAEQLDAVFGPIDRFLLGEAPNTFLDFGFDQKQLITTRLSLSQPSKTEGVEGTKTEVRR